MNFKKTLKKIILIILIQLVIFFILTSLSKIALRSKLEIIKVSDEKIDNMFTGLQNEAEINGVSSVYKEWIQLSDEEKLNTIAPMPFNVGVNSPSLYETILGRNRRR